MYVIIFGFEKWNLFGKWYFLKFNNLENLWNLEKLTNTLSVQVIKKKITENKFVNKIIE